jgi:hypothetical protein
VRDHPPARWRPRRPPDPRGRRLDQAVRPRRRG